MSSREGPGANASWPVTSTRLAGIETVSGPISTVPEDRPTVPSTATATSVPAGDRKRVPLTAVNFPWIRLPVAGPRTTATSRASMLTGGAPSTRRSSPLTTRWPIRIRGAPPPPPRPDGRL